MASFEGAAAFEKEYLQVWPEFYKDMYLDAFESNMLSFSLPTLVRESFSTKNLNSVVHKIVADKYSCELQQISQQKIS